MQYTNRKSYWKNILFSSKKEVKISASTKLRAAFKTQIQTISKSVYTTLRIDQ